MVADFKAAVQRGEIDMLVDDDGGVVGFIHHYHRSDHHFIENVAIDPAYRGKGHGRRLLRHAEEQSRRSGCAAIELYTNEKMTENLELYPRLGFHETGRREENGFNRVYFRKDIGLTG